jgi:hypothetical protein
LGILDSSNVHVDLVADVREFLLCFWLLGEGHAGQQKPEKHNFQFLSFHFIVGFCFV